MPLASTNFLKKLQSGGTSQKLNSETAAKTGTTTPKLQTKEAKGKQS